MMDKINLNYNDCFDMNNIIEITNYSFFNNDSQRNIHCYKNRKMKIQLKESKDIIIKTNLISNKVLYNSIKIQLISIMKIK